MGIIRKQTIKSSVFQYLGILVGFATILIQPHALQDSGRVGLILILTNYSLLFSQIATLGFHGTARYFPYFRNTEKKHHGYLFLFCLVVTLGGILCSIAAYIFKDEIINQKAQQSTLFADYFWYLIPLSWAVIFFSVFAIYTRMLYDATTSIFLNEFVKRLLILFTLLLIYTGIIGFDLFMPLWLLAGILPTIIIIWKVKKDNQLFLQPDFKFLDKPLIKKLADISLLGILTGSSPLLVQNIDTYFINKNFGLSTNGIYNTLFNFALVINVPSKALYNIAFSFVTEAWKNNDLQTISGLYRKSSINQMLSALFIFILIWANIDNVFHLFPPEYASAKNVFLAIAIGYIIDSSMGINAIVLGTSKYYKVESFFFLFLAVITIVLNILLIPKFGMVGAGIAYALSMLIINVFRYFFLLIRYKMQPISYKSALIVGLTAVVYFLSEIAIPKQNNFILDTIIRSSFVTAVFVPAIYFLKISEDINLLIDEYLIKLKLK